MTNTNIDRLARHITKNGPNGILIHTVPKTNNWIICQKIAINKWLMTLCNPGGNVTYNLGTVNDAQHLQLWAEITKMEIEEKTKQILLAKELKNKIFEWLPENCRNEKLIPIITERISKFGDIKDMIERGELDFFFKVPEYQKEKLIYKNTPAEKISENGFCFMSEGFVPRSTNLFYQKSGLVTPSFTPSFG